MPDQRASKKLRGAAACLRCKGRKQRCDNGYPTCRACREAGSLCSYDADDHPTGYVRSLEERLGALEKRLHSAATPGAQHNDHLVDSVRPGSLDSSSRLPDGSDVRQSRPSIAPVSSASLSPADAYLGTSSGFPLATMMEAAIAPTDDGTHLGIASSTWLPSQSRSGEGHHSSYVGQSEITQSDAAAAIPSDEISEKLITTYIDKVHSKHPFLSPRRIAALAAERHSLRPASALSGGDTTGRLNYSVLHMVYAIGARYLQLSDEYCYRSPMDHYSAALVDLKLVLADGGLDALEAMTLLCIYQLRAPTELGVWSAVGATMRQALDCGLHRASNCSPVLDQRRKRIFWTVYMLERSVALTLGRPFCISDRDIDVELPAAVADDIDDDEIMLVAIEEAGRRPHQISAISPAIHIFRLQRIISKIQRTMYRVDRPGSSINPSKISRLRTSLEDWKTDIPACVPLKDELDAPNAYVTSSYHILQYHKALLFLLLPSLTWLPTTHPDFRLCVATAGQVGQLYKKMHSTQRTKLSYSLLALHANLIAGLSLIYCFVADPGIFDARFSSDVRACGTVLHIIAERWPAAKKARDCFERFVQSTIERNPRIVPALGETCDFSTSAEAAPGPSPLTAGPTLESAEYLRIEELPPPNQMWDILGTMLGDGQDNWYAD